MHSSRMRTSRSSSHRGGGCLSQCMLGCPPRPDPSTSPWVWAWRCPPGVGLTSLLGVGLENPPSPRPDPSTSPLGVAWRPARHAGIPPHTPPPETCCKAGIPPTMHAGIPTPPREQNHRQQTRVKT